MNNTSEIDINLGDTYNIWLQKIKCCLKDRSIKNYTKLSTYIYTSLQLQCCNFLCNYGYTEYDFKFNRNNLVKSLKDMGLSVHIKSNNVLWKYLEYFTDIEDYTKCFDITFNITDFECVQKNLIIIPYKHIIYGIINVKPDKEQPYIKGIKDALTYLVDNGKEIL